MEELEESLCLEELQAILQAGRDKEYRQMKFMAALKGVDLDKQAGQDAADRVNQIKERVAARQRGENLEKYELTEHFATEYEVEE